MSDELLSNITLSIVKRLFFMPTWHYKAQKFKPLKMKSVKLPSFSTIQLCSLGSLYHAFNVAQQLHDGDIGNMYGFVSNELSTYFFLPFHSNTGFSNKMRIAETFTQQTY